MNKQVQELTDEFAYAKWNKCAHAQAYLYIK